MSAVRQNRCTTLLCIRQLHFPSKTRVFHPGRDLSSYRRAVRAALCLAYGRKKKKSFRKIELDVVGLSITSSTAEKNVSQVEKAQIRPVSFRKEKKSIKNSGIDVKSSLSSSLTLLVRLKLIVNFLFLFISWPSYIFFCSIQLGSSDNNITEEKGNPSRHRRFCQGTENHAKD